MQSDLQAPGNSSNQQPGSQPGFAIAHNNPYAQQGQNAQSPQYPQQGQPGYVPPAQYGMPMLNPQGYGDRKSQMEVQLIDKNLSSGCYSVWNCWLYVMIIEGIVGMYAGGKGMLAWWSYVFFFLNGIVTFIFAITMIGAMKKKDLAKAEVGVKLALMNLVFILGSLYAQYSAYAYFIGSFQAKNIITMAATGGLLYFSFSQLFPAFKIKKHLQSRETFMQKTNIPYNV